jgi:CRP-like cAMP-binding protein
MEREALRLVAFAADRRSFRAGDVLARKGERADTAFLVISGTLALDSHDDGRPAEQIAGEGALVGELALVIETDRPATIIARGPATAMVLSRASMRRVLAEFPDSAAAMHAALAEDLRRLVEGLAPVRRALENIDRN